MKSLLMIITVGLIAPNFADAQAGKANEDPTLEEILKRDATRADYVKEVGCLNARQIRDTKVLDSRHVAFKMGRDEYYLVQFDNRCLGLRANRTVRLNMRNSRLCKFDSIQGIDLNGIGGMRQGMNCAIPGFTQVTKAQVEQLKITLKNERDRVRALAKEERRKAREERRAQRQVES